jgi:hypothetical protein
VLAQSWGADVDKLAEIGSFLEEIHSLKREIESRRESCEIHEVLARELVEFVLAESPEKKLEHVRYINNVLRGMLIGEKFLHTHLRDDWQYLAVYIREGGYISPEMRIFLADVLSGTKKRPHPKKRPRNRPKSVTTSTRQRDIALWAATLQETDGITRTAAVSAAANQFRVTERFVWGTLKRYPPKAVNIGEALEKEHNLMQRMFAKIEGCERVLAQAEARALSAEEPLAASGTEQK